MQWPVKLVPRFLLVEDNPNLIAPYFDCCSILHNLTTWPDSHMALCHNFHSSVHLLWWSKNFAKPKQMSFKGLSASRIFHALNFWTSAISSCRSKQIGYAYAWYRRSRRRKVLIRPKNSGRQVQPAHAHPGFLPKRAKLFLCPSDAPSYVCWTLLRLIKHFMLTWHFLQGVASCDTFLAEAFSWLSRCCKWTLGRNFLARSPCLPAGNLHGMLQKLCLYHVKISGLGHGHIMTIHFKHYPVSSFDKDEAISRTDEGFYLPCVQHVDNTVCWVLAQLRVYF